VPTCPFRRAGKRALAAEVYGGSLPGGGELGVKVLFLINDGFGIGGTIKTTFNLGAALAARGHDVEVLSTARRRDVPQMPVDPAIKLMSLVETRPEHADYDKAAVGRGEPARVYPRADFRASDYDRHVEQRYRDYLRGSDADVVIATRPGLIVYAATFTPRHMVRIGQEHLIRGQHRKAILQAMPKHIAKLDAFVTVSARDAEDYRGRLRLPRTKLMFIPNSIPEPGLPPSHGRAKLVVAAGRLVASKRYDVLIRAFAKVVAERPDWQLRIYGDGKEAPALRALVLELGLHNHVRMMGGYSPIEPEWAKGAIAAVSADREPFGMTLVEAMRCGVPVVSTDAPHGPGEILEHGVDGLLTPVGDPDAMGDALLRLINDEPQRRAMAAAALTSSARFDPEPISARYEALFTELAAGKRRSWWYRGHDPVPALGPAPSVNRPTVDWDGAAPLPAELTWHRIPDDTPAPPGPLPEGDWRLLRDGVPVQSGLRDTRALMEGPAGPRVQLPFRTPDGGLAVRVRDRPVYAEVGDVEADLDGIHLTGRLIGARFDQPLLQARRDDGATEIVPVSAEGVTFRATIGRLPAGTWHLWLRHEAAEEPVRLGRFRDDIVDKQIAFVMPAATVDGVKLQPIYLTGNEFSIRATT
jgi:glycosyltransferase involved in cell wall biosynthesis